MNKDKDAKEIDVGRKVAIIGAGPAGMAAAYFLAQAGWTVAMFEAMNEPGGLLRYGVPEFRLPQSVIDEQVAELKDMGVKIHTNVFVGGARPIREILSQDYAAVLLTVGAGLPQLSDIPGHNLAGVYYAEEFLMRTQLNAKNKVAQEGLAIMRGPKVAVIGSGAGALDSARVALRLGKEVDLIFDGLEEELGVGAGDLSAGIEEGLRVHVPVQVKAVEGDADGFVRAVVCQRLEMIEKDDKLILEPVPDGMETIETQTIIFSFGRKPNSFLRHELPQLKWHDNGALWIDPLTGLTKMEKIFAAGNVTTGAGPVVDAIASGKSAAQKIIMGAQGTVP